MTGLGIIFALLAVTCLLEMHGRHATPVSRATASLVFVMMFGGAILFGLLGAR